MKQFISLSTIIVLAIVLTLGFGEYIIRKYIPNPYKTKNEQTIKHANEIETIVLGSSHTFFGYRPEFIPNSFNLANMAQNLHYDLFVLEKYGNICKNLKTVVLPISYFTFFTKGFEDGNNKDSWTYAINYKIYMDCPYHSNFSKYNYEFTNISTYSGKLLSFFIGSKIECDSLGWGESYKLNNKPKNWDTISAFEAAKRHTEKDWSALERNCKDFESIILWCKNRGIKLILITTPTWTAYNKLLDTNQLSKMYSIISTMQDKYDLQYFDYLHDIRFQPDDFYDSDHLSDIGAKKFTIILRNEVLNNQIITP